MQRHLILPGLREEIATSSARELGPEVSEDLSRWYRFYEPSIQITTTALNLVKPRELHG
jgi:hypothetical protein